MALRFTIVDPAGNNNIIDEPLGWDAISLHYIRHKDWHGFIDTVDDTMGSLQFYGDGYTILSTAFATYGVEAQCGFLAEFQCTDDDDSWDTIYQGQFSFYQYKEVEGLNGCHAECSVESITNVMTLKNRYEQKVDLNSLISFQVPTGTQAALPIIEAISTTLLNPPDPGLVTINTGDTYLIPPSVGTWGGTAGQVAVWDGSGWNYTSPLAGQILIDQSTHIAYIYETSPTAGWVVDDTQMPSYAPALGGYAILPSKTIQLTTEALVNAGAYGPGNGSNVSPYGGSSFTLDNNSQSIWSMQLSWVGGVISQDIPSFVGADPNLWEGISIGNVNPDPIFTYTPDSDYTSYDVNINIKIAGTIIANNNYNSSTKPIRVNGIKAVLCSSSTSYNDAYNHGSIYSGNINMSGGNGYDAAAYAWEAQYLGDAINFSYFYSGSVSLQSGESVYLVFEFDFPNRVNGSPDGGAPWESYVTATFTGSTAFTIDTSFPNTAAPLYLVNESLSRVAEAITGSEIRVYSDFFGRTDSLPYNTLTSNPPAIGNGNDGEGSLLSFTNGLLVRGQTLLDGSQPPMPVSLKMLFEALNAIYNIGMSIEPDPMRPGMNWLRVEPMTHFYKNSDILDINGDPILLANVDEITAEIQAEKYVGIFRTGYSKWQGEQTGGLDDFMTRREYRTGLSTSKSVLEKYCGFIGSSYVIETTRRLSGENTQDWRFDHENFVICMERPLPPAAMVTATGAALVFSGTTINGNSAYVVVVSVINGGSGYITAPSITITDSTGYVLPPVCFPIMGTELYNGKTPYQKVLDVFEGIVVISSSSPLPVAPYTVTFSAPATPSQASGAIPAVTMATGGDSIATIGVSAGGSGYSIPPLVYISPPPSGSGGEQATAIASVAGGAVISVQVTDPGSGYSYSGLIPPVVTFEMPPVQALQVEQYGLTSASTSANPTIVDPNSVYNYRISPIRNAMRWVRSIFQSYADWMNGVLYYASGEANIRATGQYTGITEGSAQIVPVIENAPISEDANISYADFANPSDYYPLYTNRLIKFTYPLSYLDWKAITANPYGLLGYSVNGGATQYGWIEELKYSPFEGTAEFTLKEKI